MRTFLVLVPASILATAVGLAACGGDDATQSTPDGGVPDGGGVDGSSGDGGGSDSGPPLDSVLQHHNHASRDGVYVQPTFTKAAAAGMKLDPGFDGAIKGNVYAQTLFMENGPGGKTALFAFTNDNEVDALDGVTGKVLWTRTIGSPAQKSGAGCGNVSPLGITGTPVIDDRLAHDLPRRRHRHAGQRQRTHQDARDPRAVDRRRHRAPELPRRRRRPRRTRARRSTPSSQNERGALAFGNGTLYVPYGGHYGDCGNYHGWVLGVPFPAAGTPTACATSVAPNTRAGGIWAPGGLSSDGTNVYVSTGNTFGASTWVGRRGDHPARRGARVLGSDGRLLRAARLASRSTTATSTSAARDRC